MHELSTTAYALLGQLALRPWTAYELAGEMRRNFHYFWPRAESGIYAEIKRLSELGLASVERGASGRRPRAIYAITAEGRAALERWLATPPKSIQLEFEALLRFFLGDFASLDELHAWLDQVDAQVEAMLAQGRGIAQEYLAGSAPFQDQVHVRAFVFDFLLQFTLALREWSRRTRAELETWSSSSEEERRERGLLLLRQLQGLL